MSEEWGVRVSWWVRSLRDVVVGVVVVKGWSCGCGVSVSVSVAVAVTVPVPVPGPVPVLP